MKIHLISVPNRIASDIIKLSHKIGLQLEYTPKGINMYVVIGNGRRDAEIISTLHHYIDHKEVASIVKPQETGIDALAKSLAIILEKARRAHIKAMLIIDRDTNDPNNVIEETINNLKTYGVECKHIGGKNRRGVYNCLKVNKHSLTAIVVNGLDYINVKQHEIEDHLLMLAQELKNIEIPKGERSKTLWERISKTYKISHYELLKEALNSSLIVKALPQHLKAIKNTSTSQSEVIKLHTITDCFTT